MSNTIRIPDVIKGQVLKQTGGGYLVRGQYVIGIEQRRERGAFWYDIYDRRNSGYNLLSLQAAFNAVAAFIEQHEGDK